MRRSFAPVLLALLSTGALAQSTLLVPEQYPTVQAALGLAVDGDSISVGPGTFPGGINFSGKRVHVLSRGGPLVTILSGGVVEGLPCVRAISGETRASILEGFTVRNGMTGIRIQNASPTIRNCIVRDNWDWGSGGIHVTHGGPLIENCLVVDNASENDMPGIGVWNSSPQSPWAVISNTTVTRNRSLFGDWFAALTALGNVLVVNTISKGNINTPDFLKDGAAVVRHSNLSGAGAPANGNIDTDPGFVDPLADFRLLASSACRDAGSAPIPSLPGVVAELAASDLDGLARWIGGAPDMGAHEFQPPWASLYCAGDGSGANCPCGNAAGPWQGCAHGAGRGGKLSSSGSPSISASDLVLWGHDVLPSNPGLFFQGSQRVAGGTGVAFGDGLRCAGGTVVRIQVRISNSLGSMHTSAPVAAVGGVLAGETRTYQLWFRDSFTTPCGAGFNLTNGLELSWAP